MVGNALLNCVLGLLAGAAAPLPPVAAQASEIPAQSLPNQLSITDKLTDRNFLPAMSCSCAVRDAAAPHMLPLLLRRVGHLFSVPGRSA